MLSDAEFASIAREVKTRSGAVLSPELSGPAEIRLQPLARRENFSSVSDMIAVARVRPDGLLWSAIADALAQTETRFFRDRAMFARLRDRILPDALARRGGERARIWSAACATGQEPYSIAMIIEEMRADGFSPAAEIIATDMSTRLLDKARAGLYTQFEVQRGLPIRKLITYFEKAGDLWRICDRLRGAVRFDQHNLLKHPGELGQFDIIVLSHVLPHFDAETRLQVVAHAVECLRPEGCILLGEDEALPEGCDGVTVDDGVICRTDQARCAA